jgi:hypothetical protein
MTKRDWRPGRPSPVTGTVHDESVGKVCDLVRSYQICNILEITGAITTPYASFQTNLTKYWERGVSRPSSFHDC